MYTIHICLNIYRHIHKLRTYTYIHTYSYTYTYTYTYIYTYTIDGSLPIVSIHRLTIVHFWSIVSIIGPPQIFFWPIVSNHRLKTFFKKTIDLIDVFYSPSIIGIDLIDVFFAIGGHLWQLHASCPPVCAISLHITYIHSCALTQLSVHSNMRLNLISDLSDIVLKDS
jgi:hypothetical protein